MPENQEQPISPQKVSFCRSAASLIMYNDLNYNTMAAEESTNASDWAIQSSSPSRHHHASLMENSSGAGAGTGTPSANWPSSRLSMPQTPRKRQQAGRQHVQATALRPLCPAGVRCSASCCALGLPARSASGCGCCTQDFGSNRVAAGCCSSQRQSAPETPELAPPGPALPQAVTAAQPAPPPQAAAVLQSPTAASSPANPLQPL